MTALALSLPRCVIGIVLALGLCACTTTGQRFDPCGVARLTPDVVTYADAVTALGSLPAATYIQGDDTFIGHWYVRDSFLTDALYLGREVSLLFGADGQFLRQANGRKPRECAPWIGQWLQAVV